VRMDAPAARKGELKERPISSSDFIVWERPLFAHSCRRAAQIPQRRRVAASAFFGCLAEAGSPQRGSAHAADLCPGSGAMSLRHLLAMVWRPR
jgi:hypothetical protein